MSRGSWAGTPLEDFTQDELITLLLGSWEHDKLMADEALEYKLKYFHELATSNKLRSRPFWARVFNLS